MIRNEKIINGLRVVYFTKGNISTPSTMIILHGWGSRAQHMKPLLPCVENAILIDLPGFGDSGQPKEVWGVTEYAEFLHEVAEKLGITRPIIVGHSFGGSIGIKYDVLYPGSIERLILIASAGVRKKAKEKELLRIITGVVEPVLRLPGINKFAPAIKRKAYRMIGSDYMDAGSMKGIYKKVIAEDMVEEMKKVTCHVDMIWGADDTATPLSYAHIMQRALPDVTLQVIHDAGHFVFIDKPQEFMEIFCPLVTMPKS